MHIIRGAKCDNRTLGLELEALAFSLSMVQHAYILGDGSMHMSTTASVRLRSALWRRLASEIVTTEPCQARMEGQNVENGGVRLMRNLLICCGSAKRGMVGPGSILAAEQAFSYLSLSLGGFLAAGTTAFGRPYQNRSKNKVNGFSAVLMTIWLSLKFDTKD